MGIGDASTQTGRCTYIRTYVRIVGKVEGTIVSQLLQALTLRLLLCVKVLLDFSGQRRITSGYVQVRKILQKTHHKPICETHIRTYISTPVLHAVFYSTWSIPSVRCTHACMHMHSSMAGNRTITDFSATRKLASRTALTGNSQGTSVCLSPHYVVHKCTLYTYVCTYVYATV